MGADQIDSLERRAGFHAALADVSRLRIVDLLAVGDASASEMGRELGMPSNLLAHHLKVLETARLVVRRRSEGDARRSYLSLNPDVPVDGPRGLVGHDGEVASPRRVLFVCTANTARSHLAVALWTRASRVRAASAGTHPGDRVNPAAAAAAKRHGLPLRNVSPRLLADVIHDDDLVITVCDRAHEELGGLGWAHWSIPDPVRKGTDAAFDAAYEDLARRVDALAPKVMKAGS
jgi:ArsR family transcriptional regulator, arsenate/arsenite/antimonite-responsive transcriptional repressor / arsenate reductase (thioredoxin)